MRLCLVQHGEPVSKDVDPDRPLSQQGLNDVEKVATFLIKNGVAVKRVWHSGKTRARQTAEILAGAVTETGAVEEHDGLNPLDPVAPLVRELDKTPQDTLIAGHLPFLSKLASALLTGSEEREPVAFKQGGVVCLEREAGVWKLMWMIVPGLLK